MQEEYIRHNLFVRGLKEFCDNDPHLEILKGLKFVHPMDWWAGIDWNVPGIYILTGGRQIGKSTSTKLLLKHVLEKKVFLPHQIFYLPCDQIDDYHHLTSVLKLFIEEVPESDKGRFLTVIDEVTFVKDWDRSIKALADEGLLSFCILTGSDSVVLKDAMNRLPGRRGSADMIDFHIRPLNFYEYVKLTSPSILIDPEKNPDDLFTAFEIFQKCGGYLRAVNDIHLYGDIRKATYLTFEQWVRGDFERRNKDPHILSGVLKTIFESAGTQVTFSALAHKMGHVVKETFIDYVNLLERMDIIFALQAFDQNTKLGFPKKAKKVHFLDPFIMDMVERWLLSERQITQRADLNPLKAESIVASNYHRVLPTYYMKTEGEIDVIVVSGKSFVPLEVKWTAQLRPQDLKQLAKYKQSMILTKVRERGRVDDIQTIPLPLFLVLFPAGDMIS